MPIHVFLRLLHRDVHIPIKARKNALVQQILSVPPSGFLCSWKNQPVILTLIVYPGNETDDDFLADDCFEEVRG